jgi:hypothetical protein
MLNRRWIILLLLVVGIGAIATGTWYYRSKCHGVDACAAAAAEGHERDTPSEPQQAKKSLPLAGSIPSLIVAAGRGGKRVTQEARWVVRELGDRVLSVFKPQCPNLVRKFAATCMS